MSTLNRITLALSIIFLSLTACKNNLDDAANAIPKDAVSVTAVNIQSLMQKADFESVKQMDFYKKAISEAEKDNAAMAEIIRNPAASGVDFSKNMYIVQDLDFIGESDLNGGVAILMSLKDPAAFQSMLQKGNAGQVAAKDGISYIIHQKKMAFDEEEDVSLSSSFEGFTAWKGNLAVVGVGKGVTTEGGSFAPFFNQKKETSIAQNEPFIKLMGEKHDVYSFVSFDKLADNPATKAAAGMMNIDPKALRGNYFTGYYDFEKGQIVSKSNFNINKAITKDWGLMFKNNVKTDFSQYLNGQDLGFAMTLGLDSKGIKEIINLNPQFGMFTKSGESKYGFTVDDVIKAFDGDVVIAAAPDKTNADKWNGMMGMKIGDKTTFDKFMDALIKEEVLVAEGNGSYRFGGMADQLSKDYVNEGKIIIIDDIVFAGDAATLQKLKAGGSVNSDVKDVLNKNIFGLYANFTQIFAQSEDMKDPEFTEMKMTINAKTGDMLMKMKDANENSLKSMMKAINRLYLKSEAEKAKWREEEQKDIENEKKMSEI